jgi:hypothetical protein
LNAQIPLELERVVLHALEKKPANRPPDAGAFRLELHAAAKRAGVAPSSLGYGTSAEGFGNGDGAAQPTGQYLLDGGDMNGKRAGLRTNETTMLAETAEKRGLQTGTVPAAAATAALATEAAPTLASQPFTRVRVLLHDRRTLLQRLKRPPVLLAAGLALLMLAVGLTAFVRTRNGATVSGESANVAASPTPSPEATPTPTPDEAVNKKAQAAKPRRANRTATSRNNNKKGSKVGGAFKKLKKILNPF